MSFSICLENRNKSIFSIIVNVEFWVKLLHFIDNIDTQKLTNEQNLRHNFTHIFFITHLHCAIKNETGKFFEKIPYF